MLATNQSGDWSLCSIELIQLTSGPSNNVCHWSKVIKYFRIQWNKRHIDNINCVAYFLLQIWDVETQRVVIKTRFEEALSGDNFYKTIPVQPCKHYRYRLTAITVAGKNLDVEGSFRTRCEAEIEDGRIREFQRSLQWNSLPLRSHARQNGSVPSLALFVLLGFSLFLVNWIGDFSCDPVSTSTLLKLK